MNKPPAYQHFARDWLVDTASLSLEEQGAYQRLLDHEWIEGPMVDNHVELARRISVSVKRFTRLWATIGRFFVRGEDGRLRNHRLEHERESQEQYRRSQSDLGRRGAEKRWHGPGAGERHSERDSERDSDRHGDPNSQGVALQSASASASAVSQLHGGASRRAEAHGDTGDDVPTFSHLMGLVRQHLYVPDGKAPTEVIVNGQPEKWDDRRDGSILKQLGKAYSPRDISIAIEGLALVRDHPGVFADEVDWLRRDSKVTLRALYNSRSGVLPMWAIATQAYWKHVNSRAAPPEVRAPVRIGDVESLRKAVAGL